MIGTCGYSYVKLEIPNNEYQSSKEKNLFSSYGSLKIYLAIEIVAVFHVHNANWYMPMVGTEIVGPLLSWPYSSKEGKERKLLTD